MNNYQDYGFGGDEFRGEMTMVPYCQFLNASKQKFGMAITPANAQLAGFKPDSSWQTIEHEFSDGTNEALLVSHQPKLLILNRAQPLMSDGVVTLPYSKVRFAPGEYKAFSYVVVWFLNRQNQPLSELPFRLKCSGYAGLTFLKNYSYYNNPNSFCKQFLNVYKSLTGDRAVSKNDVFYAHGVYRPQLVRQKATSSHNGQSSFAVMTNSFVEPTTENFADLIIKNGSTVSNRIKEFQESTKSWLKTTSIEPEVEPQPLAELPLSATSKEMAADLTKEFASPEAPASLTPEPLVF